MEAINEAEKEVKESFLINFLIKIKIEQKQ